MLSAVSFEHLPDVHALTFVNFKRCASSALGPAVCWEEDMMPGLGLLLSQDIGVQRLRGEE